MEVAIVARCRKPVAANTQEATIEMDEKVYMLNVLWFKEDGGAKKYAEYATAAGPFVQAPAQTTSASRCGAS